MMRWLYSGLGRPRHVFAAPFPTPCSSLCTELWGILGGFVLEKASRQCYFSENLLWMFITFHKQVSVIKTYRSLLLSPSFPSPSPNQSFFFFLSFFQLSIPFYKNPVIYFAYLNGSFVFSCVSTLAVMSIVVVDVAVVLRCRYTRKSFYQKRHFFVTMNTVCATHGAPLCHVCPIITRDRKRRSCANFRGRYITRKLIFFLLTF